MRPNHAVVAVTLGITALFLSGCQPSTTSPNTGAFTLTQTLSAGTGVNDSFGGFDNGGLSFRGNIAVIGAPAIFSDTLPGAAHVYERVGDGSWVASTALAAPENGTHFGNVAATNGDVAVVGSRENAYVYERNAGGAGQWGVVQRLFDSGEGNVQAVAMSGQTLVVGTWCKVRDDNPPINGCRNVAFVFVRKGETWVEEAQLTPADGPLGDFISDVAVEGDTAAVVFQGVPGKTYVFRRNGATWSQEATLTGSEVGKVPPAAFAKSQVSLSGSTLVLSDPGYLSAGRRGIIYVFSRTESGWQQEAALVGSDIGENSFFGGVLALDGNTLVTTADQRQKGELGPVYLFERNGAAWREEGSLAGPVQSSGSSGLTLGLDGDTLMVGSSPLGEPGAVYVYQR